MSLQIEHIDSIGQKFKRAYHVNGIRTGNVQSHFGTMWKKKEKKNVKRSEHVKQICFMSENGETCKRFNINLELEP